MRTKALLILSVLVLLVPVSALLATGQGEQTASDERPVVTYHQWFVSGREADVESYWFQQLEERLDIEIDLIAMINTDNLNTLATMLASNEIYDSMTMTRIYAAEYGPQGAFVDVTTTFDTAPNLKRHFSIEANPWIYTRDELYFLPGSPMPYLDWGWAWNKEVADELGIAPPTTMDEWLAAWRKVKAERPEMVPLAGRMEQVLGMLRPVFGIGGYMGATPYIVEDGEIVSPFTTEKYRRMLTFLNTMYSEGLLYQDFNTATGNDVQALFTDAKVFTVLEYSSRAFGPSGNEAYHAIDAPTGPFGDSGHMWIGLSSYWGQAIGNTAVKNGVVDEVAAIWDFYFSAEGQEVSHYGKEGETYIRKDDGTYEYTDFIRQKAEAESDGNIQVQLMKQPYNLLFNGGPAWGVRESILGGIALGHSQEQLRSMYYVGSNLGPVTPPYWLTDEEADRMSELMADIDTYRSEWEVKFIVGQEPLTRWDAYIAGMTRFGIDEAMSIVNAGFARYLEAAGKPDGYVPQADANISTEGLEGYVGM